MSSYPLHPGIPHALEKDDIYEGYHIPAGATVHALEWYILSRLRSFPSHSPPPSRESTQTNGMRSKRGITRDEQMYPDPETFNPDRWLLASYPTYREPLTTYPNLQGYSQFGFGRRTCQGLPIVEQDLFLTMGGMAWALDIRKKRRADGSEVAVHWDDYTPLLIAKPVRFEFDAVVRDAAKMTAVVEMLGAEDSTLCDDHHRTGLGGRNTGNHSAGKGLDEEFCVNVREDSPPLLSSSVEAEAKLVVLHESHRHGSSLSKDEAGRRHPPQAEKSKVRSSSSGLWPESLLVAQGPVMVR